MRLTGASCTSCGASIPVDRIAVLADRGDFAFVELQCHCGSRTMGLVVAAPAGEDPVLDTARVASRPAVGEDDLIAMHRLLEGWTGDLRTLLGGDRGGRPG